MKDLDRLAEHGFERVAPEIAAKGRPHTPSRRGLKIQATAYISFSTSSRLSRASPNNIRVFSLKKSGFCTPA